MNESVAAAAGALVDAVRRDAPWSEVTRLLYDEPSPITSGEQDEEVALLCDHLLDLCEQAGLAGALDWYCPAGLGDLPSLVVLRVGAWCLLLASDLVDRETEPDVDASWVELLEVEPRLAATPPPFQQHTWLRLAEAHLVAADTLLDGDNGSTRAEVVLGPAVRTLALLAEDTPADDPATPYIQAAFGRSLLVRYRAHQHPSDLDRAVELLHGAATAAAPGSAEHGERLMDLGVGHLLGYADGDDPDHLTLALDAFRRAYIGRPAGDPLRARIAQQLAEALILSATEASDAGVPGVELLDELVRLLAEAATTAIADDRTDGLLRLADQLIDWLGAPGDRADPAQAIVALMIATDVCPPDDPRWSSYRSRLGDAYRHRHLLSADEHDLVLAEARCREAAAAPTHGEPGAVFTRLASTLLTRFGQDADPAALAEAIVACQRTIAAGGVPEIEAQGSLLLGQCLLTRYEHAGQRTDLELSIEQARRAGTGTGVAGTRSWARYWLARGLIARFQWTGEVHDLDEAVHECHAAIADGPPPELVVDLAGLNGQLLHARYRRHGDPQDLAGAISASNRAVELSGTAPSVGSHVNLLARAVLDRYRRTGHIDDLDQAVAAARVPLASAPDGAVPPGYLADFAGALLFRYRRTADADDLRSARVLAQEAVQRVQPSAPGRPAMLGQLGGVQFVGYARTGLVDDLARAIASFEEAVRLCPATAPARPGLLTELAGALTARFQLGVRPHDLAEPDPAQPDLTDLDGAIAAHERAVDAYPPGSPDVVEAQVQLGDALRMRHAVAPGGTAGGYLTLAIQAYERSLKLAGDLPASWSAWLGLGAALLDRYPVTRSSADLGRAVAALERVVAGAPAGSLVQVAALAALGTALRERYEQRRVPADRERAVAAFAEVCRRGVERRGVLAAAREWGDWAMRRGRWDEADTAFTAALRAVTEMLQVQLVRRHKEVSLLHLRGLPAHLAYAKAMSGDVAGAVVVLEQWRAVLLSDSLGVDQTTLDRLAGREPDLYGRYVSAAERLAELQLHDLGQRATAPRAAQQAEVIVAARDELDRVLAAIRTVPGFDAFQQPLVFADIAALVLRMPVVYLAGTPAGGVALIVRSGTARPVDPPVPLPQLVDQALAQRLRGYLRDYRRRAADREAWRDAVAVLTGWLWDAVMGPVVSALAGETRAAVVPIGALGLLPLHAAWTADPDRPSGRRYVIDELSLTFVPNARSLHAAGALAARVTGDRLLVVADPQPTGQPRLRYAETEVAAALSAFPDSHRQLRGARATKDSVQQLMRHYPVIHFACHGSANLTEPLDSCLQLAGYSTLAVREIMACQLSGVRLAVLSACETAVPARDLPDEMISFPTALLQAKVAGVIGTLWPVDDESATVLMLRFYQLWRDGAHPRDALRQAQQWMRDTTTDAKHRLFPDVPHLAPPARMAAGARSWVMSYPAHKDPTQWAAFVYVGA